jgi:cytoskeleton protein RodZ
MNSETSPEELNEEQALAENGPGHLLEKKREALGLSVQEVADALHITMHYVRALETDAHDKLPGDVFIKGYLRSYASLLQLDPTVIINVYLDFSSERANAELESSTRQRRNRNRNMPWIIVSGIAFVGMAIALWYFSSGAAAPVNGTSVQAVAPTSTANVRSVGTTSATTIDDVATTRAVPSVPAQSPAPEPTLSAPELPLQSDAEIPAERLDSNSAPEVDLVPDQAVQEIQDETRKFSAEEGPERLIAVDGGGEDLVQITFSGESMVQVQDANDEQLYRDVRVAGDVLRISGTAPFNILLGDASNSELSFNGTKVDFSTSIRIDNSARLTIGL